jgi:predicted secreted protein
MRIAITVLIAMYLCGCASTARQKSIVVRLDDKETSLKIRNGNLFTIEIPVQAGTGYQWDLAAPPTKCHFISADVKNTQPENVGGKEMRMMRFSSSETGSEDVHFILHRPFENDKTPVEKKILHLTVN